MPEALLRRPALSAEFPKAPGLTKSVAEFIVNTKYADIPPDVIELGKKSILDGFGLALAGSTSVMAPLVRQYVKSFGSAEEKASIIGTGMKSHSRFAAFANGVSIHADDFDDTQLAAAKDRIYGLADASDSFSSSSGICALRIIAALGPRSDARISRGCRSRM